MCVRVCACAYKYLHTTAEAMSEFDHVYVRVRVCVGVCVDPGVCTVDCRVMLQAFVCKVYV